MTATYETISLKWIANEVAELVGTCPALQPGDEPRAVIVECVGPRLGIVDGFHRVAGYCRWANDLGIAYADVQVRVLVATDEDLIADASEPGTKQDAALNALYKAAR